MGELKMTARSKTLAGVLLLCFAATSAHAQTKLPRETRNAALRYWLSFADMQDPPADKATAELLEKTAAGEAAWDEGKLGAILDKNETAIWRMQRATTLPDCDWGLEYDLGPLASIAYAPKARVLARLNTLEGMRLAAKGETGKAIDTWLAGIRFSQHLSKGGSLIFALIAKVGLLSSFRALTGAAKSGALSGEQKKRIESAVRALPETGFDWGQALSFEGGSHDVLVRQMAEATNLAAYYQETMGKPAPANFTAPNPQEIAAFHKLMNSAEEALRSAPETAGERLKALQASIKTLHPLFHEIIPSFTRINDARVEVKTARQNLLQVLAAK